MNENIFLEADRQGCSRDRASRKIIYEGGVLMYLFNPYRRFTITLVVILFSLISVVQCTGGGNNIMDVLRADGSFSVLVQALEATDLTTVLSANESYTLLAPTNAAFAKLSPETMEALLQDRVMLAQLLQYHLIEGAVTDTALSAQPEVATLLGNSVTVRNDNGSLKLNNARVVGVNMEASNGLIYPIDTVLTAVSPPPPPAPSDIAQNPTEVWLPYPAGSPLPIKDAELIPGAPEMRQGVAQLGNLLTDMNIQINTARTVRLEESNEITYLAPVGPEGIDPGLEERGIVILGAVVLTGEVQFATGPGTFLVAAIDDIKQLAAPQSRLRTYVPPQQEGEDIPSEGPAVIYVTPEGEQALILEAARLAEMDIGEVPAAAIFFGTKYCEVWVLGYHYCFPCGLFGPYETLAACQASG